MTSETTQNAKTERVGEQREFTCKFIGSVSFTLRCLISLKSLSFILFDYAEKNGDLEAVTDRIEKIYANQENVDIDGEVAAELTGKYLFEDKKFLENLMRNKSDSKMRQIINKIKELINDLVVRFKGTEQEKQLREVQKKFIELYNSAEADAVGETTKSTQYALNKNVTENDIEKNINAVVKMQSVASLSGNEFEKGQKDLVTQVEDFFNSINNVVNTQYGDVKLKRVGIKASIAHGMGRNKAVAFKAVPNVINNGKIIDYQQNRKKRGYDTVVFAAPIDIAKTPYFMAVVVNIEANENSYYLHEVALQKKEDIAPFKTGTDNNNGTSDDATSSVYSLLRKLQDVNCSFETDSEYLELAKNPQKNAARLREMVDSVAKANGYTIKAYHATNADFNVFDIEKTSDINYHGKGIYFTNSISDVESNYENYEGPDPWQKIDARAYELADEKYGLSYEDTLTADTEVLDKLDECYDEAIDEFKSTIHRVAAHLKFDNPIVLKKGESSDYSYDMSKHDGIIDEQVYENIGHSGMDEKTVHYVVRNPRNIKSAELVTYDDNGNIIPLSERFDSGNSDIRYSLSEQDESSDEKGTYSLRNNLAKTEEILYDNSNPLAVVNRAKSNNNSSINWVYESEIFSVAENKQFHEKISEINQGSRAFDKNSRGEYMLPIGNKIVFTDGNYDSPYIREIVEVLTDDATEFEVVKESITGVEKGKYEKSEKVRVLKALYGDGFVVSYRSGNDGVYEWENGKRKGSTRRAVVGNYLNERYGIGNDNQSAKTRINNTSQTKKASSSDGAFFDDEKNGADKRRTKYSIVALENGNVYVQASRKVVTGTTLKGMRKDITSFFNVLLEDAPSIDIPTINGDVLTITKAQTEYKARDNYKIVGGQRIKMSDNEFAVKTNIESHIDEVAETSVETGKKDDRGNHSFARDGFMYRKAYFEDFDGRYYEITLSIGENDGVATVYNVGKIKESVLPSAKVIAVVGSKPLGKTLSANSIPQTAEKSSDGRSLTSQQSDFFSKSKVRDEDGNLLTVYHGTDAEFTVFDKTKGRSTMDIQGSFFSPWELDAAGYGGNVKPYYLNITNPASEGVAYKALNKFKGENNAGVKAREYLESLGYDGVNNGNEEYEITLLSNYPASNGLIQLV